jgi:hypothetical protein
VASAAGPFTKKIIERVRYGLGERAIRVRFPEEAEVSFFSTQSREA